MKKYLKLLASFVVFVFCVLCKRQNKTDLPKDAIQSETKEVTPLYGPNRLTPNSITRTIIQDRKGIIWVASWHGVFRYDGKLFTDMTSEVSSARFFSALEDSKGNLWFGSIGSGVYRYDGKYFQNFTTKDGLPNNEIVCIYEDKIGNIWFGVNGGASRYDGKSFRNYILNGDSIEEDTTGKSIPDFTRPPHEVNSIIEDHTGTFWFGTRGHTFVYDGQKFTTVTHDGQPFKNVRTIIEDEKGTIWLGGMDGLWRHNGTSFANIAQNFVGDIYEDQKGNVWTSSETTQGWVLSRYDEKSLSDRAPTPTEINPLEGKMLFGILEAADGSIWFGADDVYRYDGTTITDFKK